MNFSEVSKGQSQITEGCYQREVHMLLHTALPLIRVFNMGTKIAQYGNCRLRAGQGNRCSTPDRNKTLSLLDNIRTGSGTRLTSHAMANGECSLE